MFRHTITRVRPSVSVYWRGELGQFSGDRIEYDFEGLEGEVNISEDGLTKAVVRTADNAEVFELIEANLNNPSHPAYEVTRHCTEVGITTTFTLEEI